VVGLILIILDFLLYCLLLGPIRTLYKTITARRIFAKAYSQADINGDGMPASAVWRSVEAIAQGRLTTSPEEGVTTAYEALVIAYKKNASAKAQGMRPLLRWQKDDGFRFEAKVRWVCVSLRIWESFAPSFEKRGGVASGGVVFKTFVCGILFYLIEHHLLFLWIIFEKQIHQFCCEPLVACLHVSQPTRCLARRSGATTVSWESWHTLSALRCARLGCPLSRPRTTSTTM
jgi:hypothetical protein